MSYVVGKVAKMKSSSSSRSDAASNKRTEIIFKLLTGKETLNLVPVIDHVYGARYPQVERSLNLNSEEVLKLLEDLVEEKVLTRNLYDKVFACPKCGSINLYARGKCSGCGSFDIEKKRLIEHLRCGTKFVVNKLFEGYKPVCPKDKMELDSHQYRVLATWFECNICRRKVDAPEVELHCMDCGIDFSPREAEFREIYSYSLSEEVSPYVKKLNNLRILAETITAAGYEVRLIESIEGLSGSKHTFDIVAYKYEGEKQKKIVVDLYESATSEVDGSLVISVFAKVLDTNPDMAIFAAIPSLSEVGKNLAKQYNIQVVEGGSVKEVAAGIGERISK
jgi:hypothetical protein